MHTGHRISRIATRRKQTHESNKTLFEKARNVRDANTHAVRTSTLPKQNPTNSNEKHVLAQKNKAVAEQHVRASHAVTSSF